MAFSRDSASEPLMHSEKVTSSTPTSQHESPKLEQGLDITITEKQPFSTTHPETNQKRCRGRSYLLSGILLTLLISLGFTLWMCNACPMSRSQSGASLDRSADVGQEPIDLLAAKPLPRIRLERRQLQGPPITPPSGDQTSTDPVNPPPTSIDSQEPTSEPPVSTTEESSEAPTSTEPPKTSEKQPTTSEKPPSSTSEAPPSTTSDSVPSTTSGTSTSEVLSTTIPSSTTFITSTTSSSAPAPTSTSSTSRFLPESLPISSVDTLTSTPIPSELPTDPSSSDEPSTTKKSTSEEPTSSEEMITSTAVETKVTTLPGGIKKTITSTSFVEMAPSSKPTEDTSSPSLQDAGSTLPRNSALSMTIAFIAAYILLA